MAVPVEQFDSSSSDLRYQLIRGLIALEKYQRSKHFLKSAAECTSRAIISLELADKPIKSVHQATQLNGIGASIGNKLKEIIDKGKYSNTLPIKGKFLTSAAAFLVGLLDLRGNESSNSKGKDVIPTNVLKTYAKELCEENIRLEDDDNIFCPASWRLTVLVARRLIQKRIVNKKPAYQLLPFGEQVAMFLRGKLNGQVGTSPLKKKVLSPMKQAVQNNIGAALYTNDSGRDGIILLVDIHEQGGDRVGLGKLTEMLRKKGVIFRTARLKIADYCWTWRVNSKEYMLPYLVERKRADDLAHSLVDGRFHAQIERMKKWRSDLTQLPNDACLKYVLEGRPESYVVKCLDGCGGVAKCGYPTPAKIKEALHNLKDHFDVITTNNLEVTVDLLTTMTISFTNKVENGELEFIFNTMTAAKRVDQPVGEATLSQKENKQDLTKESIGKSRRNLLENGGLNEDLKQNVPKFEHTCTSKDEIRHCQSEKVSQLPKFNKLLGREESDEELCEDESTPLRWTSVHAIGTLKRIADCDTEYPGPSKRCRLYPSDHELDELEQEYEEKASLLLIDDQNDASLIRNPGPYPLDVIVETDTLQSSSVNGARISSWTNRKQTRKRSYSETDAEYRQEQIRVPLSPRVTTVDGHVPKHIPSKEDFLRTVQSFSKREPVRTVSWCNNGSFMDCKETELVENPDVCHDCECLNDSIYNGEIEFNDEEVRTNVHHILSTVKEEHIEDNMDDDDDDWSPQPVLPNYKGACHHTEQENNMAAVKAILPDIPDEKILEVLHMCSGDVQLSLQFLLDDPDMNQTTQSMCNHQCPTVHEVDE